MKKLAKLLCALLCLTLALALVPSLGLRAEARTWYGGSVGIERINAGDIIEKDTNTTVIILIIFFTKSIISFVVST